MSVSILWTSCPSPPVFSPSQAHSWTASSAWHVLLSHLLFQLDWISVPTGLADDSLDSTQDWKNIISHFEDALACMTRCYNVIAIFKATLLEKCIVCDSVLPPTLQMLLDKRARHSAVCVTSLWEKCQQTKLLGLSLCTKPCTYPAKGMTWHLQKAFSPKSKVVFPKLGSVMTSRQNC